MQKPKIIHDKFVGNLWPLPLAPAGGELRFVFFFFNINYRKLSTNYP